MSEITNKNYVVNTRNTGKFYVTKIQSDSLVNALMSNNPPRIIKIDEDTFFSSSDYINTVPAWKDSEISREKAGDWKCSSKNWHGKFDQCKCNWGMDTKSTESKIKEKELTEEQKERGSLLSKLIKRGFKIVDIRKKSNKELLEMLES